MMWWWSAGRVVARRKSRKIELHGETFGIEKWFDGSSSTTNLAPSLLNSPFGRLCRRVWLKAEASN